jgi:acyl-CoA synthetase (AMP-forming)/AMP-acid ligase II
LAREHLARFAYPRRVVFEEFPRNTSGKIDRSATKERFAERG